MGQDRSTQWLSRSAIILYSRKTFLQLRNGMTNGLTGWGDDFAALVRQKIEEIVADPERFAISPLGCRYARLTRFPYLLLYELNDEELILLGVFHTAQSWERWKARLGNGS